MQPEHIYEILDGLEADELHTFVQSTDWTPEEEEHVVSYLAENMTMTWLTHGEHADV